MKCPTCGFPEKARVKVCPKCGEAYATEDLLALSQLEFLLEETAAWGVAETLRSPYSERLESLRARLERRLPAEPEVAVELEAVPAPPTLAERELVAEVARVPTFVPPVQEEIAPAAPVPALKPVAVPKLRPPLMDWGKAKDKVIEAAVSGALLRGLLYLGAFMFVVSVHILLLRFRGVLPAPVQLAFLAVGPGSAYLAGWGLRSRLKLPQAGGVLTAIGALLVAGDFAGIYQFGGLTVDITLYWMVASAVCTAVYVLTAWRLPLEFFGYITLLGAGSTLLALARVLALPLEWQIASLTALATAVVESAWRLGRVRGPWSDLSRAAWRLPQLLVPIGLAMVLFDAGFALPVKPTLGHAATFAFASLGYGLLAWRFPARRFAYAAVLSSVGAAGFALWAVALPLEWYATAAAAVAPLYILAGQRLDQRLGDGFASRRAYARAATLAGFALVGVAVLAGFVTSVAYLWPGVIALSLAALALAGCTYLLRRPMLVLLAAGLFLAPYSLAIYRWLADFGVLQPMAWLVAAWAGLALAYLGLAVLLRTAEQYGVWLNLIAHALTPLASLALVINYYQTANAWSAGPTLAALGTVIVVYFASAVIHDSRRYPALSSYIERLLPDKFGHAIFIWPVGFLLPLWLAIGWWGSTLHPHWLGAALAGAGLAYVGLGQLVARRRAQYRLPVHVYAYVLAVVAILVAFGEVWPLLTSLYVAVGVLAALALVYRRVWETAAAGLLFIWPIQLSLTISPLTLHLYSLAYALLASLAYIPLAVALDKAGRKLALPIYATGYGVSAYALVISLLGRFGVYPLDLRWVGVAVPLIVTGLQVFGLYRLRQILFGWAAALAFAIAFGQTLSLLRVPPAYHAAAWVGLAFVYVLTERALAHRTPSGGAAWWRGLRLPLGVGGTAFCALGLLLTAQGTTVGFTGGQVDNHSALLLAQGLAVLLTGLAAWLYRSRWPLYLEPWLAFFPVTLFFIGYGARLFGRVLTPIPQHLALPWLALAIVQVVAAVALDRYKERYAHGPYLAGYLLAALAILWSAPDRVTNLYTLGAAILLALVSHVLVHTKRHQSFEDLIGFIWRKPDTIAQRGARTAFLFFAAYGLPLWLARLLAHYEVPLAWHGVALALTAPLYVALGLAVRRLKSEYAWPLYSAGYALTAIGAMVTFQDEALAIWVLGFNTVVYAASAYIFRRPFWLYLCNTLVPVVALLTLHYNFQALPAPWVGGVFMMLAFLYFGAGQWFDWRQRGGVPGQGVAEVALPFYAVAYPLSAVALAVASGDKYLALVIYSAGVVLYALSAWTFRESMFLYPAAWLAAVPYFLGMTLTPLPRGWYGLGWLPLVIAYIGLGRFVFQKGPLGVRKLRTFVASLTDPAMPFYLLAYALSVSMIALSQGDPLTLVLALLAGAVVYFASAALFRLPAWLYPGLVSANLALLAYLAVHPSGRPIYSVTPPFLGMTWAMALAGYWLSRGSLVARWSGKRELVFPGLPGGRQIGPRQLDFRAPPFVSYLVTHSWAQPLFVFAAFGLVFWQALSMPSFETAVLLGTGHAVLLGVFAMLWQDTALAYGTLACILLAACYRLRGLGLPLADVLAWVGGIGFGLYWVARIAERAVAGTKSVVNSLAVWPKPLTNAAIVVATLATIGTLPAVATHTTATAVGLASAGALYLAIAYQRRNYPLGYLGMPMIIGAWALALVVSDIRELQLFAIPVGLYLTGMGFLERRRARRPFAIVIESFGLSVLLLTSFAQSLNGVQGFPYFLLLLVEAPLVIWWGASRLLKVPFLIGLGASVLNVVAQVVVLTVAVRDVRRWFIIAGVSLVLLIAGILAERHRERIVARSQELVDEVMTWD